MVCLCGFVNVIGYVFKTVKVVTIKCKHRCALCGCERVGVLIYDDEHDDSCDDDDGDG